MSEVKWTEEQLAVIGSADQNLLVSAAAGSGKTAVLVERIIRKVLNPERPVDIDRMLIVTFTNAAAAQLREKVRAALMRALQENPGDQVALRQLSLLAGDHIQTIDRFCREVVLDHYEEAGVDPSFRIGDEGELKLLQTDAAQQAIEEAYACEDDAERADFTDFVQCYVPGSSDRGLEDLILRFYNFSQSHAFPRRWRAFCAEQYEQEAEGSAWQTAMREDLAGQLRDLGERAADLRALCQRPGGPDGYAAALADDEAFFCALQNNTEDPDALRTALSAHIWARLGRHADKTLVREDLQDYVKKARDKLKKETADLAERLFALDEADSERCRRATGRYMRALVRLTDRFEEAYDKMKQDRNTLDFSDVAHRALRILVCTDEAGAPRFDEDGQYIPSATACLYRDYFEEVCIDEYQDSNPVQELLLWSVSRESAPGKARGYDRFMVGDVKQSIYRFRMAEPDIFIQKSRTYSKEAEALTRRIDLHRNFRSRTGVIDGVNTVFRRIMRREVGGVAYDADEELVAGAPYPEPETPGQADALRPELLLVQTDEVPGALSAVQAEAEAVADRIRALVGTLTVYDAEQAGMRPASYGDIAILLRTSRGWAETFSRVLTSHGIPNRSGANTGYFDAVEVRTILAYLNVLDNPRQDIPLAASLCSDIGHLDERELAALRAAHPEGTLYDCVEAYLADGPDADLREKLEAFRAMTARLRGMVSDTPIHLLLWAIYDATGFADTAAAAPGGRQKRANLDLLTDKAIAYEETSYRGLFHFIRYIEKLRRAEMDFGEAPAPGGEENYVRIMTMHASKGLEFPVVFVSGLGKQFNLMDASATLTLHAQLGAGLDYVDSAQRVRTANRIKSVIGRRIRSDSMGEELRVLYVAMTRAREKLILSACTADREAFLQHAAAAAGEREKLLSSDILGARSMAEWVTQALVLPEGPGGFSLRAPFRLLTGREVLRARAAKGVTEAVQLGALLDTEPGRVYSPDLHRRLRAMLDHPYPYAGSRNIPGKLSVSELKHATYEAEMARREEQTEAVSLFDLETDRAAPQGDAGVMSGPREAQDLPDLPTPLFLQETREMPPAGMARGTAYHAVLAAVDFTQDYRPGQAAALLESMVKCDRIQSAEARSLDVEKIERFLRSDLAERMRAAARRGALYLEQPFVIGKPAGEVRPEWAGEETVLIQGIIDAFFLEGEHIILLDYKSDYARPGDEQSLADRYRTQFDLYRDALRTLLDRPVTEAWLYALRLGKAIAVT